ncbi:MAG TPA: xanthine dehydrogenase family protein molybdopterin-binding subunit [Stellaceae bacterium]|nr:xanthine dehydrogenase family protein molybdopterin-binding subunit [Stellaceae bacterium]
MGENGIGARLKRKEDFRLLQGRGRYVGDIRMPGLIEVAFVRSPAAHARIQAIKAPPGFETSVLTAHDLAGVKPIRALSGIPGFKASDYPPLASGKVRYAGEAVALALGRTRAEAEDLAQRVEIELDPLPAVTDALAAREPRVPLVHEAWGDNLFMTTTVGSDIDEIARRAPVVVRREYRMNRQCMAPLEGKGVLAYWDDHDDQLVVVSSTQSPHMIRAGLSEFLGLEQRRIRVVAPDVGGGFGYKVVLQPEELCVAWLALTRRHPVRWTEDRREHLTAGANTRQHHHRVTAYADTRGKILAVDAEITVDIGAYSVWPFTAGLEGAMAGGNLAGPYALPAFRCRTYSVATNKPPFVPYRAVARPGVCFAMELTIDALARAVGREPAELRIENLVPAAAMPFTNVAGKHFDSGDYPQSVRMATERIGLSEIRARQQRGEADGRLVGVGFGVYTEQSAHGTSQFSHWGTPIIPGYEQATVRVTPDGGAEIRIGVHSHGQGMETTMAQVACEILGIAPEHISVVHGDTAMTPFSTGTYASRSMVMAGGAVSRSAREVAKRLARIGAHLLQEKPEDVRVEAGFVRGSRGEVSIREIANSWYRRPEQLPAEVDVGGLEATIGYKPKVDTGAFSYATHAAVVAVDRETGGVDLLDYVIVEDCGTMVNPMIVEGQAMGGTTQGIGTALYEESPYDADGQPLAATLADYVMPGALDAPSFRVYHTEHPSPYTDHGIKGVGEGSAIAPPAAIVNAINDALRPLAAEVGETPATPPRILRAIRAAETA